MDKMGKLAYSNPALLYYYKGVVGTPPLQKIDAILALQKCSRKSLQVNATINMFMDLENSLYQKIIVTISTWEVKIIHVKH